MFVNSAEAAMLQAKFRLASLETEVLGLNDTVAEPTKQIGAPKVADGGYSAEGERIFTNRLNDELMPKLKGSSSRPWVPGPR